MKKKNAALIISAALLTTLAGCTNFSSNSSDNNLISQSDEATAESSQIQSEEETQPDPDDPNATSESHEAESSAESTSETVTTDIENETSIEITDQFTVDRNGAVILKDSDEQDDAVLIAAAQVLYDSACETSWKFSVGCPYSLDYNIYVENDLGWQFYLITDNNIKSLQDVRNDYDNVFSSEYEDSLDEIYIEKDGAVYSLDGERGMDIYYISSKVKSIEKQSKNEIFFVVESNYNDDYMGTGAYTKEDKFSAVISSDGNWRAGLFTLPY